VPVAVPIGPEATPLGKLPLDVHPTLESLHLDIDPRAAKFTGTAVLEIDLDRPRTVIWLHGRGLAVTSTTIAVGDAAPIAATYEEVDPIGVARVTVPAPVHGHVKLAIAYAAAYDPTLVGVYRVAGANTTAAVFSKFEAIYARRAFPCFDEPRFKIPFDVAIDTPVGNTVIGNMPGTDLEMSGVRRTTFARTPPLPTYLVAFAVGPFDRRAATPATTPPIGGVAWQGRGNDLTFALAEEPALLASQATYFGVPFPYPKLDLIAVPDFQSGAMENAGAITFRDSALLVDDRTASFQQRTRVIEVVAHETAHQWFGDLVTMPWWNDLWLNEGFATFLATRTVRAVHPELEPELDQVASTNGVMSADSLASARKIRQPIETTNDITNAFDGITYEKGAAVLAMLEHHLGDDAFRAGVHAFLVAHATGNATTDDLVAALTAAGGERGRDVPAIATSFLDRAGVPVVAVHATCEGGRGKIALAQTRWQPAGVALPSDGPWTIPVCLRTDEGPVCTVLATASATVETATCPAWVMPNADAAGYYRFTLGADDLAKLSAAAGSLSTAERLSYANNLEAAFRSGALPGDAVLAAFDRLASDPHGDLASAPFGVIRFVDDEILEGAPRAAFRAHVAAKYAAAVKRLGWRPAAKDRASDRTFRAKLFDLLALTLEDRATLAEAARLGARYLAGDTRAVDPDLLGVALDAVARRGDAKVFDALVAQLVRSNDAQLRGRLLGAIANVRAPALVARALDLALDPRLRSNERITPIAMLLGAHATRDQAWAWLGAHYDAFVPLLPDRFGGYLPSTYAACDAASARSLEAFFGPRVGKLTGGPRNLANAIDAARQCEARATTQRASVTAYAAALK
jgi:alanyl aminopeptidase